MMYLGKIFFRIAIVQLYCIYLAFVEEISRVLVVIALDSCRDGAEHFCLAVHIVTKVIGEDGILQDCLR